MRRESLATQVSQQLMLLINKPGYEPGSTLPSESILAERFQVSRPVVREALMYLKSLGIIDTQSGKRAVIQQIDSRLPTIFFEYSLSLKSANVCDLLEVRRGLEVQCVELAAQRVTSQQLHDMETLTARMSSVLSLVKAAAFTSLDVEFHLLIAHASGNPLLVHLIEAIREPLRESILEGFKSRKAENEVLEIQRSHERIVAAIGDGDSGAAAAAMADHFDRALIALQR